MNIIRFTYGSPNEEHRYVYMFDIDREKQTPDAWLRTRFAYQVEKLGFKILSEEELGDSLDAAAQFFEFLADHFDFTYMYSDDHSVWKRGVEYEKYMKQIGAMLPRDAAVGIYNAMIDRVYNRPENQSLREQFHWQ